jgi:hypothetical protein
MSYEAVLIIACDSSLPWNAYMNDKQHTNCTSLNRMTLLSQRGNELKTYPGLRVFFFQISRGACPILCTWREGGTHPLLALWLRCLCLRFVPLKRRQGGTQTRPRSEGEASAGFLRSPKRMPFGRCYVIHPTFTLLGGGVWKLSCCKPCRC